MFENSLWQLTINIANFQTFLFIDISRDSPFLNFFLLKLGAQNTL
jgi:hypothetical protein